MLESNKAMSIKKTLNAPIELVSEVWTDADQIAKWWGPNGFTNTIQKMNLVPGGEWRLVMHGRDGKDYNNRSEFREIVPHKKIIFHISIRIILERLFLKQKSNKLY